MALRFRPTALLWGLFVLLGLAVLWLRLRHPDSAALPGLVRALLSLLFLRVVGLLREAWQGQVPLTRLLLPSLILVEGLGLELAHASSQALRLRLGTALALEVLLLVLAIRAWRSVRQRPGAWPEQRLAEAFEALVPPRAARLMALELVMLGSAFGFLFGGFRSAAPAGFSHHREAALRAILPALPLMIPGDFLLTKALFSGLAPWLRWFLHGSTVYAVLWLVGFYATLKARPHQLKNGQLELHQGLLKSVTLPVAHVLSAAPLPDFDDDWARHAYTKGMERLVAKGNTVLELKLSEPVQVLGLLGPGRPTTRLAVSVDEPAAFLQALSEGQACPCA
jgi:hypothetical protein